MFFNRSAAGSGSKNTVLSAEQISCFMEAALTEAEKAAKKGDVPVGAVIVKDQRIIARAHNRKERQKDTTAHAEILAIQKASKKLKNWRLTDCTLFATVEPCIMCSGAICHARISTVYYGCSDPKFGGYESLTNINQLNTNHQVQLHSGIMAERAASLLKKFFQEKRKKTNP